MSLDYPMAEVILPHLCLPATEFPMQGGLPAKEPQIIARWQRIGS